MFSSHIFALGHLNIAALFSNVIVPYTKFTCSCNSFVLYKFNSNMSNFFLIHHDKKSKYIFYGKKIKSKFVPPFFVYSYFILPEGSSLWDSVSPLVKQRLTQTPSYLTNHLHPCLNAKKKNRVTLNWTVYLNHWKQASI